MSAAFATIIVVSRFDRSPRSLIDHTGFVAQTIRSEAGIGAARVALH